MIAPGVILTALHVVIGPGRVPTGAPPTYRISMLADLNVFGERREAERTAVLAWPGARAGENDGDIALLRVQGALTDNMQNCDPLLVLDDRVEIKVGGCGLPQFVKAIRDTEEKEQGFWVFRGRVSDRPSAFDTLADFVLEDQRKPEPEEWRGASGSNLVHEESNALIGVLVHADHTGYAQIRGDLPRPLIVETVAAFARRDDFRAVARLQVVTRADLRKPRGLPIIVVNKTSKLLPRLDRTEQNIQLKIAFRPGPISFPPVALIAKMREYDQPDLFLETVSSVLATAFRERRCSYEQPTLIHWDKDVPPEEAVASLKQQLPAKYDAWDDQAFDELLRGGQKPRLYPVRIGSDIQPPTQGAFASLLSWWSARAACEGGPATLLLSVIESSDGPNDPPCPLAKAIMDAAGPSFGGPARVRLPSFLLCTREHLNEWARDFLRSAIDHYTDIVTARLIQAARNNNNVPLKVYADALREMGSL
jgi:hypothetical protein